MLMQDLLCARQLARDFHVISFNLIKTHQSRVVGAWLWCWDFCLSLCARSLRLRAVKELAQGFLRRQTSHWKTFQFSKMQSERRGSQGGTPLTWPSRKERRLSSQEQKVPAAPLHQAHPQSLPFCPFTPGAQAGWAGGRCRLLWALLCLGS